MPNLNIVIPDELHKQIKLKAVMTDKTLKEFILDAIEEEVKE